MIRDRLVFCVSSQEVREKLINEGKDLTLEKAVQIGQSCEYAQEQLRTMTKPENTTPSTVHAVKGHNSYGHKRGQHTQDRGGQSHRGGGLTKQKATHRTTQHEAK